MPTIAVPLTPSHVPHASMLLARAFHKDPFFTCVLPDAEKRAQVLPWLSERMLRYGLRCGAVYTTPSVEGAAIWLGPQHPTMQLAGTVQAGLFLLPLKLSLPEFQRSLRLSNYADRLHKTRLTGPHLYLLQLGVEPSLQGQGIGWVLLRQLLALAARQALPCYLDTYNEKNLPFYQRGGFTVVNHGQATPASPPIWAMLWKPV